MSTDQEIEAKVAEAVARLKSYRANVNATRHTYLPDPIAEAFNVINSFQGVYQHWPNPEGWPGWEISATRAVILALIQCNRDYIAEKIDIHPDALFRKDVKPIGSFLLHFDYLLKTNTAFSSYVTQQLSMDHEDWEGVEESEINYEIYRGFFSLEGTAIHQSIEEMKFLNLVGYARIAESAEGDKGVFQASLTDFCEDSKSAIHQCNNALREGEWQEAWNILDTAKQMLSITIQTFEKHHHELPGTYVGEYKKLITYFGKVAQQIDAFLPEIEKKIQAEHSALPGVARDESHYNGTITP